MSRTKKKKLKKPPEGGQDASAKCSASRIISYITLPNFSP